MIRARNVICLQQRWKSGAKAKQRWSVVQGKKTNIDRALEHFDDFYASVYGARWRNMRAALLTEHKYVAMVNNFGDTEKTCSSLELDGAINVKSLVDLARNRQQFEEAENIEGKEKRTAPKHEKAMDERIEEILKRQEDREVRSVYPAELGNQQILPGRLREEQKPGNEYDEDDDLPRKSEKPFLDPESYKKSLSQVLEEDMHIDHTRLIDPKAGTGALYEFIPATKLKGMDDWILESEYYNNYCQKTGDFPLKIELDTDFTFPENLLLYTYEMGNCSDFKPPRKCLTGVLSHYLMDGASILPPLLLNVQHGEEVLDACAAPGGKSLLMLQSLNSEVLVCNDVMESRVNRIRKVMEEYVFDFKERWEGKRVVLTQTDARNIGEYRGFDKILVDVPCTTSRHSLRENDNNIFKPSRIKERLRIPELQAGILANCLRLLRPGGELVYSTCSLSPIENDGVIHLALQKAFNDHGITATIKDLSSTICLFADLFKFEQPKSLKYGQMVMPFLPANFGPMYFSKIKINP